MSKWSVRVEWKPQDCWVGVFWRTDRRRFDADYTNPARAHDVTHVWICLVPMLPIHLTRRTDLTTRLYDCTNHNHLGPWESSTRWDAVQCVACGHWSGK